MSVNCSLRYTFEMYLDKLTVNRLSIPDHNPFSMQSANYLLFIDISSIIIDKARRYEYEV
jgi:hypothetical protein